MKTIFRHLRVTILALFVFLSAQLLRLNKQKREVVSFGAPRVLLIGAYGNGNFGDDVIGQAIVEGLEGNGSVLIAARLPDTSRLSGNVAKTVVVGGGLRSIYKTWKLASESDVAILGGGGLLEGRPSDVNVHRLILEYLGKLAVCGLRGDRTAIHGIGVSPNLYSNPMVNIAVRAMFRATNVIAVRDQASQAAVQHNGGTAALIRDPAVVLFEGWAKEIQRIENTVGAVLLDHHRWPAFKKTDPETEKRRTEELQLLASRLVTLASSGKRITVFNFHWSDVPISEDLSRLYRDRGGDLSSLTIESYNQSSSERPFKLLMACDQVLTMRFHPALAALTANATVDVVGNLQKLEQLRASANTVEGKWQYPSEFGDPLRQLQLAVFGYEKTGETATARSTAIKK